MLTGAIIAGGRSTRFGEADKTVADLAGTPMIRRVADRLAGDGDPVGPGASRASGTDPVVNELVVNCRADQQEPISAAMADYPLPVTYVMDEQPDLGPAAGIRNVCRATDGFIAVVASDMPFVDPGFIETLADQADGYDAVVPQLEAGWYQTTQAVYRASAMAPAVDRALEAGEHKIIAPLEYLDWTVVNHEVIRSATDSRTFKNLNTLAEFEAAADQIVEDRP